MEENRSDPLSDHRRERDVPASNPGGPGYVQTPQNNATVVVGKLDLDREVARAVQRSGTLNLQGEINVGASITKTENVHHDNRIYKPHYGDVHHKHVTKTYITSKYVVCDDSQASEKSLDASANKSDTLHHRQRNLPKKKISLRNKRKPARVPYNYKLAQAEKRSKPLRDLDAGRHRPTFRWMSGTAVLCCLAVLGVLTAALWILPQSESPSTIQNPSTDGGRYPHSQHTQTGNAFQPDASQKGKHERTQDEKGTGDTKRKDSVNSSPLHKACRNGNLGHIDELLQTDTADVNARTSSGDTCLHIVSAAGRSDIVSYLVRHNAVIDVKNKLRRTPLHEACRGGHLEIVQVLCQYKADTNVVDSEGKTPLTEASTHGYSQIVKVLIKSYADVNIHSIFNVGLDTSSTDRRKSNIPQLPEVKQPLMSAVEFGYEEIVQHLLEKQAQVNVPNKQGWIEIHVAAFNGNLSIVEKLANKGADIHAVTDRGATPLILASQEGHATVVSFLLQRGAKVNHTQADGATAMLLAAENGRAEVVKVLKDHEAATIGTLKGKPTSAAYLALKQGHTETAVIITKTIVISAEDAKILLFVASYRGDVETVKFLITVLKVDVNAVPPKSGSPLFSAASRGHDNVVKVLLENGAKADMLSASTSPLLSAISNNHTKVVDVLLDHGFKNLVNSGIGSAEITPLEFAVYVNNVTMFKTLLKHGANPALNTLHFRKRKSHTTLCHIIFKILVDLTEKTEMLRELLDHGVSPDLRHGGQSSPLSFAIGLNRTESVKILLEYGAQSIGNLTRVTPLSYAAYLGMTTIVEILLQRGANIESEDLVYNVPLTPLGVAAMEGHAGVAQVLLKYNASVNFMSEEGSLLYIAAEKGHTDIVRLLLEHKADVELGENKRNVTPLIAAAEKGHVQILELLLRHWANPNFRSVIRTNSTSVVIVKNRMRRATNISADRLENILRPFNFTDKFYEGSIFYQTTALFQAIANNHTDAVITLLLYGANPNIKKRILKYYETPLSHACTKGNLFIVSWLLGYRAEVNARDRIGDTALHEAASIRRRDIIEVLISYGGDMSATNDDGYTPMDVLVRRERAYHFKQYRVIYGALLVIILLLCLAFCVFVCVKCFKCLKGVVTGR